MLSIAGPKIDFVDVHWYPGGSAAAESLAKTDHVDDAAYLLRQQITRYAGPNAARIGISLTELNVGVRPATPSPARCSLADAYSGAAGDGVFTVDWWNVHNGIGTVTQVAGQTDYGDFGLLSSGGCTADGSVCEPPLNTPFAPYHALAMMSRSPAPATSSSGPPPTSRWSRAHAVRRANGDLAVLLLNKDPDNAHPVTIDYAGFTPRPARADGARRTSTAPPASPPASRAPRPARRCRRTR